jgi:hypothetical protein
MIVKWRIKLQNATDSSRVNVGTFDKNIALTESRGIFLVTQSFNFEVRLSTTPKSCR